MTNKNALARQLHAAADRFADGFVPLLRRIPYRESGILPSEMLLFLVACKDQAVTHVVESGRCRGYSTEVLAEAGLQVISIDRSYDADCDRLKHYPNLQMRQGDGVQLVPRAVVDWRQHHVGVLLDGPKGEKAFRVMDEIHNDVALVAIHDLHQCSVAGGVNRSFELASGRRHFLSQSAEWIARFGHLDKEAVAVAKHESRESLTAFGYWLGIFPGGRWRWTDTAS